MDKYCQYCFELLVQRDDEKPARFAKRVYCGKSCAKSHKPTRRRGWSLGNLTRDPSYYYRETL